MDDLDAILADLQLTTNATNAALKTVPTPVYAEPFRPPDATPKAVAPIGETRQREEVVEERLPPPPVIVNDERNSMMSGPLDLDPFDGDSTTDDYAQELRRLQEPSRTSNIDDLDDLLFDLNSVQKNYGNETRSGRNSTATSAPYDDYPSSDSNATKDLDCLMESLQSTTCTPAPRAPSAAAAASNVPNSKYASSTGFDLDGMMASLDTELALKGGKVSKRGICAACDKMILNKMVTALGKSWHPEHFVCVRCNRELGSCKFFEKNDQPYCEEDYHAEFAPRCFACNMPIVDKCITALQKTWHPDCFVCVHCHDPFNRNGTEYHVYEGRPYCKRDYCEMFAPKCAGCKKAISNNVITALRMPWHVECFVCAECKCRFGAGTYYEHDGKPYCEQHYHENRGSLCAACNKPISGRVITAMRNKFHPEHFVCAFCITPLSKGTFKENDNRPYCHECYRKLFVDPRA